MNEILLAGGRIRRRKEALTQLLWNAAGSVAVSGLYPGKLHEHFLMVVRRDMTLRNLGPGWEGATVAQISDLHASPLVSNRYLRQCVEIVNLLEPDFVALTGDFITGLQFYARRVAQPLRGLRPKVAALSCLGNHDYGVWHPRGPVGQLSARRGDLADCLTDHLGAAGVEVLRNRSRSFRRKGSTLQFAGVEDLWTERFSPAAALAGCDRDLPTVALCHNPDAAPEVADNGADWILAGHTHGRARKDNVLHNLVLPTTEKRFSAGRYSLGPDKYLYVNRGLGYAQRSRLANRPEITIFTLRAAG